MTQGSFEQQLNAAVERTKNLSAQEIQSLFDKATERFKGCRKETLSNSANSTILEA